ncbi:MAG: aminotransferase class IV [Planctomycetota bacterium]
MKPIAYLNGKFLPLARAEVSILDRGFLFGDGIYEVVAVHGGRIFAIEAHVRRFFKSARGIQLPVPVTRDGLRRVLAGIVRRNHLREGGVYLELTRGVAPRTHAFPREVRPTLAGFPVPEPAGFADLRMRGRRVITVRDIRWARCDVKNVSLLANVLAKEEAHRRGADEAVFTDGKLVFEGSSSNIFAVLARGGRPRVVTPPLGAKILPGVTRGRVLAILRKHGIPAVERPLGYREMLAAKEVFLTGTLIRVMPILRVDGRRIGTGRPGPITGWVAGAYAAGMRRATRGAGSSLYA